MVGNSSEGTASHRLKAFVCHDLRDKKDTINTSGQPEKGIVLQLSEWLEAHDIDVWRSDKELTGGETWKRAIYEKAIPTCDLFVVCLTKHFVDKTPGQRHREVTRALEIAETKHPDTTFIIPIRIERVHYPGLGEKQYINYYKHLNFDILLPVLEKKRQQLENQENTTKQTTPRRSDSQSQSQGRSLYQQEPHHEGSSIQIERSHHINIAPGGIIITNPDSEIRTSKWITSRRLFLGGLLALAGGGIAWFALSHRTTAIGSTPRGKLVETYQGHSDWVIALTWSPDSIHIASASADKTVQVWNAADGGQVYRYPGHNDFVYAVAWSPDGRRIASASSDGTVRVWEPMNGTHISTYKGSANAAPWWTSVAWSPDSTRVASGALDGTVQVWYAGNGGQVYTYHEHADSVNSVAWSPDGTLLASASSDGTVQVWNALDGKLNYTYLGHSGPVETVAWSLDSKRIASGGRDNTVQIWDAVDGEHVFLCRGHTSPVEAVAWSPDGKHIASGSWDATVRIWNAADGQQVYMYTGHSVSIGAVGWAPNGTCIASGDGFPQHGAIQVWGTGD